MAKKSVLEALMAIAIWVSGVIVSLAVGLALINGTLAVPLGAADILNQIAGWIVVVLTIIGVIAAIVRK